ncbi:MAG: zinc-ribbon domain-containing protein [Deltaproteobacteria bacterium]|nr:zinc-ribbon domain-containing protein [Deltaproteobacteria bacterium]
MIIECERCHTKFNLDEDLLKKSGSKVRCSICKHVFTAFPPKEETEIEGFKAEKIEEVEILPPEETDKEEDIIPDVDKTIVTEALGGIGQEEEEEGIEAISFEDISQIDSGFLREQEEEGVEVDINEAMDRAAKIEEKIFAREEGEKEEEIEEIKKPGKPQPIIKKRRRSAAWTTILLIVVILFGAAAALYVFKPDLLFEYFPSFKKSLPQEPAFDMGNKRLSIKRDPADLKGYFVDSEKAGKLFVVKGSITNNYPDKRSFIRIRSNILNSKGKVVKSKIVYAGNTVSDTELLSLSMVEINNHLMNKFGKDNVNTNILPNSSIPFIIIFNELPEDISEFTVEPINSFPAEE